MEEKVLIQYRFSDDPAYQKSKKVMSVVAVALIIGGFLYGLWIGSMSEELVMAGMMLGAMMAVCGVAIFVLMKYQGKMSITVTPSRVFGRTMYSEVSLPMDSITMTNKNGMKNLRIESPSENFMFSFGNKQIRNDVYDVINQQIAQRNNNKGNVTVVNNASNADELKKYKDLLDSGVITQEEFDAKKKQLLGL